MPASVYHRALLTQPGRIAGLRVRPFSCWHLMVLESLGNRFIVGGQRRLDDLVQMLLVCRDSYQPAATRPLPSFDRFQASPVWRGWLALLLLIRPWQKQIQRVESYIEAYSETPAYWQTESSTPSKTPLGLCIAARLIPVVGESRAWNMPFSLACAYKAAMDERDGAHLADEDIAEAEVAFAKAGLN
jgi:hypothetical protein